MTVEQHTRESDWDCAVPESWPRVRNKQLLAESLALSSEGAEELLSVSHISGITPRSEKKVTMIEAESLDGYRMVEPGDLVINMMWAWMGALGISRFAGIVSPAYSVYRPRPGVEMDSRYYDYLYRSDGYIAEMTRHSRGIHSSRLRIYPNVFLNLRVPEPPLDVQRATANFLDRETARVNSLINEQQRLIEILKERRQAVVEQAVFGGLEGAETNENDEPWLPETPRHWPIMQLGFAAETLAGYAFPSDGFSSDERNVRLLRGINIKPGRIDWSDVVHWDLDASPIPAEFSLMVGDLVLGMDRPFVNDGVRVASIGDFDTPALLLQRVMRIRPLSGNSRRYFRYAASTGAFLAYLEPLFTGVSVPHISEWQVRRFKMPLPPLDEQERIAGHLDEQTAKIDTLIAETEKFIELALERRSALVTAAVTGQIDVRETV
jgi:type I restriction enzyme S subunit